MFSLYNCKYTTACLYLNNMNEDVTLKVLNLLVIKTIPSFFSIIQSAK